MIPVTKYYSFIHSAVSHDRSTVSSNTSSHRVRSSASSSNFQYPLFSLRASSSCLHLLPRVTVTSILLSVFPSITCVRRQFLHNIWPIQLAFILFNVCRIFLSTLTVCNTSSFLTRSVELISILLQHHISLIYRYF